MDSWIKIFSPVEEVVIVNAAGHIVDAPCRCSRHAESTMPCSFTGNGSKRQNKPLLTATGPVFLFIRRLRCSVHCGEFAYKPHYQGLLREGESFRPSTVRLGKVCVTACLAPTVLPATASLRCPCCGCGVQTGMQFTAGFLTHVLMTLINTKFVVAAVRRQLVVTWMSHAMERLTRERHAFPVGNLTLIMERLTPHEESLSSLIRTLWHHVIAPTVNLKDAVLAELDGCVAALPVNVVSTAQQCGCTVVFCRHVVRVDATFQVQEKAFVSVGTGRTRVTSCALTITGPCQRSRAAVCSQHLMARVLPVTGKRGLLLQTPKLLHAEKGDAIMAAVSHVLEARKAAFGEHGCPSFFCTDNVRRDSKMMTDLLTKHFPVVCSGPSAPLICQDISHRLWAFTRVLLPRHHPDAHAAKCDVQILFGRFTYGFAFAVDVSVAP